MEWASPTPDIVRGYKGMSTTGLSYSLDSAAPPDLREIYIFGRVEELPPDYLRALDVGNRLPLNIWPASLPGFRAVFDEYDRAMQAFARRLLGLFAVALELPQGFFDAKIDKNNSFLLMANYPALDEPPLPHQLRAGPHSDFGVLTIVHQDAAAGGLQAQRQDGSWADITPAAGALVVNLGDIMAQWTNDRWVSSMHRVVLPPLELAASSRRQSLVYFFHPNYDAMIECMPTCTGPARPPRYPPTVAHAFLLGKTARSLSME